VEEALPALQPAHASQRDQVAVAMTTAVTKTRDFFGEMVEEIKKVTWPDYPQLKNATFVILVFILLVSLIIWLMDVSVRGIIDFILGLFAG
jgi:preprotein translocase subunit SecE